MSYASKKGYRGEEDAAEFFNKLVGPQFHVCRIGGIEKRKTVYAGDVSLVGYCKRHNFRATADERDCYLSPYFIEAKNQANPRIWQDLVKAESDARVAQKAGVILYAIKTEKNQNGERIVVMRPEILARLLQCHLP